MVEHAKRSGVGLVLVALTLSGCQTGMPGALAHKTDGDGPTPHLGSRQVADVQIATAQMMEKRGEKEQALAKYQDALKQDAQRGDAALRVAVLLDGQGKFAEAQEYYRKARETRPNSADVPCCLGYSYALQGRLSEAEAELRKAVALQPHHVKARNNLGLVLAQLGKADDALAEFQKGGCSDADAHANVAFGLSLRGDLAMARQHYERSLAFEPNSVETRRALLEVDAVGARLDKKVEVVKGEEAP